MVGNLTTGKKCHEAAGPEQDDTAVKAQTLKEAFLADIDADTLAFGKVMAAFALPKKTAEEQVQREAAVHAATLGATLVPLTVLERCLSALDCAEVALRGNINLRSDAGVAVLMARAAAEGAYNNVSINLKGLTDSHACAALQHGADVAMQRIPGARRAAVGGGAGGAAGTAGVSCGTYCAGWREHNGRLGRRGQ